MHPPLRLVSSFVAIVWAISLSCPARGEDAAVVADGCQASCVDWYGNSRPIFVGSRTFALMGYELVEGRVDAGHVDSFLKGIQDGEDFLKADRVRILSANNSHSVVELELSQGKNREVRRLFESIDRPVGRLQRVQIGPIPLGQMPPGRWRVLTPQEVKSILRHPSEDRSLNGRSAKPAPRS